MMGAVSRIVSDTLLYPARRVKTTRQTLASRVASGQISKKDAVRKHYTPPLRPLALSPACFANGPPPPPPPPPSPSPHPCLHFVTVSALLLRDRVTGRHPFQGHAGEDTKRTEKTDEKPSEFIKTASRLQPRASQS
jgi:hypothetical protein